jgi:WD40 repeat protein
MQLDSDIRKRSSTARLGSLSPAGVALLVLISGAAAQYSYFGKSKVQTRDYPFQSLETEHFRILFYPGGEALAEFAASSAEEYYQLTSKDLGVDLEDKVPLLLYLSPGQFSETNVTLDIIEEGVGGFSELIRDRIVIPFDGSYGELHHVIGHELTHIFEFRMFYRSRLSALMGAVDEFSIPLWVMEGFAEFQCGWAEVRSETFMRDLVISDRLVPLQDLNDGMGYLVYREGQSFFDYVAEKYGRKKVYEFLHALNSKRRMDGAFSAVFGLTVEKVSSEWVEWLRIRYWPQIVRLGNSKRLGERLTNHTEDHSIYNTAPAISPSGTKVAMISDRLEYADVYVLSALDGHVLKRLVKGERSGGFENLHLLRPGVAWSPDEKVVVVVTTSGGRDNLAFMDYASGKVLRRIYGNLDAIYSPKFSPDGKRLVFVGVKNGFSDVYEVAAAGGEPRRVTYDMYEDRDPTYSPGGDTIAFVSDRPDQGQSWTPGAYAVWLLSGANAERLTERGGELSQPVFTHSGEYLLYTASDSASNIHAYSLLTHKVVRRTDLLGDASYLSLSNDDRKLAYAYYNNVGWDIAVLLDPLERLPLDTVSVNLATPDTFRFEKVGLDFSRVKPVGFSLALDYAIGAASYGIGPSGGLAGTLALAFSDILGNNRFELYTDLYGDILNSNLLFQYWLLPYRVDYGFALFQLFDVPYYVPYRLIVERLSRGGQAIGVYPFNKFTRLEAGLTGYRSQIAYSSWSDISGWYTDSASYENVFYVSPAFVLDNTFWDANGPARGTRTRLGADVSFLSDRHFQDAYVDFRNYQRLGRRFVFASMLFGIRGFGRDADEYYIGGVRFLEYAPGQLVVRGYQPAEFYEDKGLGAGLFSFELRYPFIDRLKLAFPLPIEFGGIRGVAFMDGGLVQHPGMRIWDGTSSQLQDLKLGVGVGIRFQIAYFPIKLDLAKPLSATTDRSWKFIFGLGADF